MKEGFAERVKVELPGSWLLPVLLESRLPWAYDFLRFYPGWVCTLETECQPPAFIYTNTHTHAHTHMHHLPKS